MRILLRKWFGGELDEEQTRVVEQWVSSSVAHREEAKSVYRSVQINTCLKGLGSCDAEKAAAETTRIIRDNAHKNQMRRTVKWLFLIISPILCVTLFLLVKYYLYGSGNNRLETTDGTNSVILTDGTRVLLDENSSLTYPDKFGKMGREVFLKGNGWFEVSTDPYMQFVVETDGVKVNSSGTEFNIDNSTPGIVRVSLANGFVIVEYPEVRGKSHKVRLFPGEEMLYDKSTGKATISLIDIDTLALWRKGNSKTSDEKTR